MSDKQHLPGAIPDLVFKTRDHPTANGRSPQPGDAEYSFQFILHDRRALRVLMGAAGCERFERLLQQRTMDVAVQKLLTDSEVVVPAVVSGGDPDPQRAPRAWSLCASCPHCGSLMPAMLAVAEQAGAFGDWRWDASWLSGDGAHCHGCDYTWPVRQLDLLLVQRP